MRAYPIHPLHHIPTLAGVSTVLGGTMHARTALTVAAILAAALTACSSDKHDAPHHYTSAQAIADKLEHAGMTVSMVHKDTDDSYITQVGGTAYNFTVSDKAGQPASGDSGINMFPNGKALGAWTPISQSFGGIAVTGDTWAVSLATETKQARKDSARLAPEIAKVLGGSVKK